MQQRLAGDKDSVFDFLVEHIWNFGQTLRLRFQKFHHRLQLLFRLQHIFLVLDFILDELHALRILQLSVFQLFLLVHDIFVRNRQQVVGNMALVEKFRDHDTLSDGVELRVLVALAVAQNRFLLINLKKA